MSNYNGKVLKYVEFCRKVMKGSNKKVFTVIEKYVNINISNKFVSKKLKSYWYYLPTKSFEKDKYKEVIL